MSIALLRACVLRVGISICCVAALQAGLEVRDLGKLKTPIPRADDRDGTGKKWSGVRELLGDRAGRVVVRQLACNLGGNTSVRNRLPLVWKEEKGYYRRARDLGQVFTAPGDLALEAIVLRTGNDALAFLPGAAGAEVFVQFFEVSGTPVIDDNGTPPGTPATHGFSKNHRCDDRVTGVDYRPLRLVRGGIMPDLLADGDGRLNYTEWRFTGDDVPRFEKGGRYAFMIGFAEPAAERNFTLANHNNASSPAPPAMVDEHDRYPAGWGLRREGNGETPPLRMPGPEPPARPDLQERMTRQASFPAGPARFAIPPTCEGYPDVDTYRDLEFYLISGSRS